MKKSLILLLLAGALGGGAYYWFGTSHGHSLSEKSLTFAEVRPTTIRDIVSATGLIEPREIVLVSTEMPGTVVRLSGRIGDLVAEGAELGQLDERKIELKLKQAKNGIHLADTAVLQADAALTQAKAALTQAKANKEAAERNLTIQKELKGVGGFRAELEQATAQLQAALAGVESAQAGIEAAEAGVAVVRAKKQAAISSQEEADLASKMTRIKVPGGSQSEGLPRREFLIIDRKVQEGQMVGPQSGPLFTLAGSLDVVEVHAQVAEGDINKIREGLPAVFTISAYNDDDVEFEGRVKNIRPSASSIKGAVYYDAVIEMKNRKDKATGEWQLRLGMTASVDIIRREHKNVWRVPSSALNFTLDEAYQTDAIRARVAAWKQRPDAKDWQTLWTWDEASQRVEPVFVRIGGLKNGEPGLKDSEGNEILEWEGKEPAPPLRIIIGAPPARGPSMFDQPSVKI